MGTSGKTMFSRFRMSVVLRPPVGRRSAYAWVPMAAIADGGVHVPLPLSEAEHQVFTWAPPDVVAATLMLSRNTNPGCGASSVTHAGLIASFDVSNLAPRPRIVAVVR